MADHLVLSLVVSKCDGAVVAFEFAAAGAAKNDRGISPPVEQNHNLLAAFKTIFDFLGELARDDLLMPGILKLQPHIDNLHFGERTLLYTIGQFDQSIFVRLGIEVGLK